MQDALIEKCIAWSFATIVAIGFVAGVFRAWQMGSVGLAIYVIALGGLLGWLALLYLRKQRNVIYLSESGISWRRGSETTEIAWTDVVGFSEAPSSTAWLVRAKDGRTLRIDKLLVGVPTTFVQYLRAYLSPALFDTAIAYVRPKAALRARIDKPAASV